MGDIFDDVGGAKERSGKGNYIGEGRHLLILKEYGTKKIEAGQALFANFVVAESATHGVGELVSALWRIQLPGWQGEADRSRAQAFIRALLNLGAEAELIAATGRKLADKGQPGRGIAIVAYGVKKPGKDFVDVVWEHVAQTKEEIAETRRLLDGGRPPKATQAMQAPPPAPAAEPVATAPSAAQAARDKLAAVGLLD